MSGEAENTVEHAEPKPSLAIPEIHMNGNGKPHRSESIAKLAAALAKAQLGFKPIEKNVENTFFSTEDRKAMYADLAAIISATQKSLAENGLVVIQSPKVGVADRQAGCTTTLVHESGEWLDETLMLPAFAKRKTRTNPPQVYEVFDAQTIGAAITYARRYTLAPMIGVCAETDFDANQIGEADSGSVEAAQAIAASKIEKAKEQGAVVPAMHWKWNDESQMAEITGPLALKTAYKGILEKARNKSLPGIVVNGESLEALKFEFQKAGVHFEQIK